MLKDIYSQPNAPDPVLDDELVLSLAQRHVPEAKAVTGVDESGGEARTYAVDEDLIVKVQRPQQLRPRTSLEKEVFFLNQLAEVPEVSVPRVLGHGREGAMIEYTVMTRMPGSPMRHLVLGEEERTAALVELGKTLRRIHEMPREPFEDRRLVPGDRSFDDVQARFRAHFGALAEKIRSENRTWNLDVFPRQVGEIAVGSLPRNDERVALHSNPGPEHTFVFPETGSYSGLIDFGDAYISHPAFDLRRRAGLEDREAILRGYTANGPVSEAFMATWRAVMMLSDMTAIAYYPERAAAAERDLAELLAQI